MRYGTQQPEKRHFKIYKNNTKAVVMQFQYKGMNIISNALGQNDILMPLVPKSNLTAIFRVKKFK